MPAGDRRLVLVIAVVAGVALGTVLVVVLATPPARSPGAAGQPGGPDEPPVVIVAHGGARAAAPENTMAAYDLAVVQGAHVIEADATRTADGEVVAFHDPTLTGLTDAAQVFPGRDSYRVEDFTLDELAELTVGDAGEPHRIPTLRQVTELARRSGVGLLIDMKPDHGVAALEPAVVDVLDAVGDPGWVDERVLIGGFVHGSLQETRRLLAERELRPRFAFIAGAVVARDGTVLATGPEPTPRLVEAGMTLTQVRDALARAGYGYLGLGILGTRGEPVNDFGAAEVELFRAGGVELNFFTNSPDEARSFAERGVSSILTDDPARLAAVVGP